MTAIAIKSEIQKVLNDVTENSLQAVLDFLMDLQHQSTDEKRRAALVEQIINKNSELLEKLAQ